MPKIQKKYIVIIICSVILISSFFIRPNKEKTTEINISQLSDTLDTTPDLKVATLLINNVKYNTSIENETTVESFMNQLKKEGKIIFTTKSYTGMGTLIDSINGISGGNGKYWTYYVNGVEAQVGVSNYKLNPHDVVSWEYK